MGHHAAPGRAILQGLGSVGRECIGSRPIRLLDEEGNDVAAGEAGDHAAGHHDAEN